MKHFFRNVSKLLSASMLLPLLPTLSFSVDAEVQRTTPADSVALTELMEARLYETDALTLPYRLYVPDDYSATKEYPLILFLHGAGERGNDNALQLKNAIGQMFADPNSPVYRCIVVAPQCPADSKWVEVADWTQTQYSTDAIAESAPLRAVVALLEQLKTEYSVDADRVYASGLSMGGYGTWDLLVRHTDLFAAGIPVCGGADYRKAERLKNVPIYTFHGLKDPTVPYNGTERMVQAIRAAGGDRITYITYPEGEHGIWETAFATEGLYEWLLSQRLSDREEATLPPSITETTGETTVPTGSERPTASTTSSATPLETTEPTGTTDVADTAEPVESATVTTAATLESDNETEVAEPNATRSHFWLIVALLAGIAAGTAVIATIVDHKKRH